MNFLSLQFILTLPLITAALFYLGSRAVITQRIWSRYPPRLAAFMDCASCSGFWFGVCVSAVSLGKEYWGSVPSLYNVVGYVTQVVTYGLISLETTPLIAALHQKSMEFLGSAVEQEEIEEESDDG